jgi:putative nucleotidyltransferase with HDIG domain
MALMFGIGTIVVFGIGWTVARSLTEPLFQLLRTARRVTQGDLTARSGLVKDDEIGALASAFDAMTQKLQKQHLSTIRALTSAIDARDPYTLGHSVRVAQLSVELGRSLGLPKPTLQHIEVGGYLHDIGKIGIRDAVLLKPGALTKEQRTIIEDHPRIGLRILEAVDLAPEVLEFVGSHHERLDGSGYPLGLRDADVPAIPRIGAVADVYDAITTDRPYRKAMTIEEALALLRREAESGLLDMRVVETLAAIASMWEERLRDDPSLRGFDPMELMAA